jgi:hypothetical protein
MVLPSRLQAAYEAYLDSDLEEQHAESLARELSVAGLSQEAQGLRHFLSRRHEAFLLPDGPWRGCSCSAWWRPPEEPRPGELWFDVVELIPMVFVAELPGISADVRGWAAIRPVQVWQYSGFLRTARPTSPFDGDRFDAERFADMDPLAPAVDVYPDEAEAYAGWFGKWSVGRYELSCAEGFLTRDRKEMLSPGGLLLWDLSCWCSGWYDAVGFRPGTGELIEEEFYDCDRDRRVGFATCACLKISSRIQGWKGR